MRRAQKNAAAPVRAGLLMVAVLIAPLSIRAVAQTSVIQGMPISPVPVQLGTVQSNVGPPVFAPLTVTALVSYGGAAVDLPIVTTGGLGPFRLSFEYRLNGIVAGDGKNIPTVEVASQASTRLEATLHFNAIAVPPSGNRDSAFDADGKLKATVTDSLGQTASMTIPLRRTYASGPPSIVNVQPVIADNLSPQQTFQLAVANFDSRDGMNEPPQLGLTHPRLECRYVSRPEVLVRCDVRQIAPDQTFYANPTVLQYVAGPLPNLRAYVRKLDLAKDPRKQEGTYDDFSVDVTAVTNAGRSKSVRVVMPSDYQQPSPTLRTEVLAGNPIAPGSTEMLFRPTLVDQLRLAQPTPRLDCQAPMAFWLDTRLAADAMNDGLTVKRFGPRNAPVKSSTLPVLVAKSATANSAKVEYSVYLRYPAACDWFERGICYTPGGGVVPPSGNCADRLAETTRFCNQNFKDEVCPYVDFQ